MRKHLLRKNNRLKRIMAVCIVMLLLCGLAAPAFANETPEAGTGEEIQEYTEETDVQPAAEENIQEQAEQNEPALTSEDPQNNPENTESEDQNEQETDSDSGESEGITQEDEEKFADDSHGQEENTDSGEEIKMQPEADEKEAESQENEGDALTELEPEIDSSAIQNELDSQMTALMTLDSIGEPEIQEVTKSLTDIYPQYANYNGEMEGFSVDKAWTGDAEYNRPESITLDLCLDDQVIDTLTLTAEDDWKGSFDNHYPAYKLNSDGTYALDENGEKIPLTYKIRERDVANYKAAYSQETHRTTVDSSTVHLFVPATELKAGEQYIAVSSNQPGQQKIYRAEAYQTDKMLSSQVTVSDKNIKDKDGNIYDNYILMNDGDGSYDGLLWNAYDAGNNKYYMFSNVYEIWGECHGLIQMSSTQSKMSCPHVSAPGSGTDANSQGFYNTGSDPEKNAYKTATGSENLYFYKEVTLPDGAFNRWQTEAFVSNRYDPPIMVDPSTPAASEKADMGITKNWENDSEEDRPESITVHLYADGEDTGKTLTLSKDNNWSDSFKDLDVYKDGKKISYSVSEDVPEGYKVNYKYSNTDSAGSGSSGKGYWVRTDKLVDGETYLIVTSPDAGSVVGMEINSSGDKFNWTSKNAGTINVEGPITVNGQTYQTHITQEEAEKHTRMQWTAHSKGASSAEQVGYHNWFLLESVSNPGCYPKFNGTGDISDGSANESYLYYGLQWKLGKGGQNGYVALDENGKEQKRTPTVENYPDDFSYVFGAKNDYFLLTSQQTGDANSKTAQTFYLYKFVMVSGPSATITNTRSDEKTRLAVYKNWRDDNNKDGKRPGSIEVELLKNGKSTGKTLVLNAENNWSGTFEDLPKLDERGKEIQYSAKELNIPEGYTSFATSGTTGGTEEEYRYSYAWTPVTSMQPGKEYILAAGTEGSPATIGVSGGKATLSGTAVSIQNDRVLTDENGNHYSTYITDEDAAKVTRWTAEASGSYVILKNGKGYLEKGSGDLKDSSKATKLQYDDSRHALMTSAQKYMAAGNGDFNKNSPEVTTYLYERVRIKDTITTDTTQFVTSITNTYKKQTAEFILQKLDGNSGERLSGNYRFTLKDADGTVIDKYQEIQVDADGQIHFEYLEYGDYLLEETQTEDGYGKLPEPIQITASKDGIQLKNEEQLKNWIQLDKNSDDIVLINVKNYKMVSMPETGSNSRLGVMLSGFLILTGGVLLMINNKKRGVMGERKE